MLKFEPLTARYLEPVARAAAFAFSAEYTGYPFHDAFPEAISDFAKAALQDSMSEIAFVAFFGFEVIGGVYARESFINDNSYDLNWVFTAKEHRGKRVGSNLLHALEEFIGREGMAGQPGTLFTSASPKLMSFYRTNGYEQGGRVHDGFVLTKVLNHYTGGVLR